MATNRNIATLRASSAAEERASARSLRDKIVLWACLGNGAALITAVNALLNEALPDVGVKTFGFYLVASCWIFLIGMGAGFRGLLQLLVLAEVVADEAAAPEAVPEADGPKGAGVARDDPTRTPKAATTHLVVAVMALVIGIALPLAMATVGLTLQWFETSWVPVGR